MKTGKLAAIGLSVLLVACGGGGGDNDRVGDIDHNGDNSLPEDALPRVDVRDLDSLFSYRQQSSYKDVLKPCALVDTAQDGCSLQRLPYIGQAGETVTRDDVMDRLLVSHDWMGQRFETLLNQAPDDMLPLFGSVTVIIIGSTVRPSSYWKGTGGIRLDPKYLWMTLDEKANVSIAEDYRSDYGKDLNFWSPTALHINGKRAYPSHNLTSRKERSLEDLEIAVYSLLYHELGHAVDYVPAELMPLIDPLDNPINAVKKLEDTRSSTVLSRNLPLVSTQMAYLAQVRYQGAIATEQQKAYTPFDVGGFMSGDGALEYYSYNTVREDFTNMLESAMLKKNFDVDLMISFVDKPLDEDNYDCEELTVGWGQYNRLSDPLVWPRAKWTVDRVYGQTAENDAFFNTLLDQSSQMTAGLDWCTNRDSNNAIASDRSASERSALGLITEREQLEQELRPRHH